MPFLVSRVMCFAMTSSFSFAFVARARPERPARRADFPRIVACGAGRRAFDGASLPTAARLCQSKRKSLPGEGRSMENPLPTSINPSTFPFD